MKTLLRLSAFGIFLLVCLTGPASAQVMRITTDNPTDNTVMNPSGTTLLTITLSVENFYCNWSLCYGPSAHCWTWSDNAPCDPYQPLEVYGYDIVLNAVGGTVTWGTFTPADPSWKNFGSRSATNTQVEINYSQYPSVSDGTFTLGTIPVTTTSPFTTHIEFGRYLYNSYFVGTSLGVLDCLNPIWPGPYRLGDVSQPCFTDWFDAFGTISPMDACLAQANHGQCVTCCKDAGGLANTCSKFCQQIKGGAGEPQP